MRRPIVAVGDPHGDWQPLLEVCQRVRPAAVLIVGDCDLSRPIHETLAPLWEAGIRVRYVIGNHDVDSPAWFANLVEDHPTGNLHGRAEEIEGVMVAGLSGIYSPMVWFPKSSHEHLGPFFWSREAWLRKHPHLQRQRDVGARDGRGLPIKYHGLIFPEDHDLLAEIGRVERADILLTHEAPPTHRYGFLGIQQAAEACGAKLVIHGHHHQSYEGVLPNGCKVRGLARGEPWVVQF
ncbi:metallophosphoesterase [Nitrospirillum sp. BR 11752]|uniref:metallophosphoesterase family protein n=1 Tax=Nitrospirillum sp. BR 11752 TaxID=3104293 RepID=UPI002EB29771|nr:metallophosphoesterase [Nitrospirillum sp. BR 11752]